MTPIKGMSRLVNRTCIDASFWDAKQAKLASIPPRRLKATLRIHSTERLPIDSDPANAGIAQEQPDTRSSSP